MLNEIVVIGPQAALESEKFKDQLKNRDLKVKKFSKKNFENFFILQIEKEMRMDSDIFADCFYFTIMTKLSPQWNKVGDHLMQGSDFLSRKKNPAVGIFFFFQTSGLKIFFSIWKISKFVKERAKNILLNFPWKIKNKNFFRFFKKFLNFFFAEVKVFCLSGELYITVAVHLLRLNPHKARKIFFNEFQVFIEIFR